MNSNSNSNSNPGLGQNQNQNRVVVTGVGAVTPHGIGAAALWEGVAGGRSAITRLDSVESGGSESSGSESGSAGSDSAEAGSGATEFDGLAVRIGGRVRGFDAATAIQPALEHGLTRKLSPVQHWAIAAADEALGQALRVQGRAPGELPWDPFRVAVIAGTGSGPIDAMQKATRALDARGPRAVPISLTMLGSPDSAAAILSQRYGTMGAAQGISATCASGAIALGEGLRRIRHGYADAVLVVGMEDCLNAVNLSSNANLRALAAGYEDDPTAACRPFDRARSGFVMAQGAAAILLESERSARDRGATILAELAGFGAASDAHHPTAPHPEGRGGARAVTDALADAGIPPEHVDHINAHGTGTPVGDPAELAALESALGRRARGIPISATKASTGHLLGASGVVEAVLSIQALREGILPPTLNLDDPEFDGWDIVAGSAREQRIDTVLSISFGFGGHNGAVVFRQG